MNRLQFGADKPMDFIAVGRLCVDLNANETGRPMEETRTFTKYVGGSPANIAIGMSRLGANTGFIGKVSDDQMGRFIVDYLRRNRLDTSQVTTDRTGASTGLAFTEIKSPTDCSILMYRDNAADLKLSTADVSEAYVRNAKVMLISGTALAASPSREAVFLALEYARRHDVVAMFDLDYRPYTWKNSDEIGIYYALAAEKCDVIIGTREEFDLMERFGGGGAGDEATADRWFAHRASIVVIKHGKDGSFAYTKEGTVHRGKVFPANIVKTFGAGDAYASSFIYGLLQGWSIDKCMEMGSASAAIVISSHSCSDALPDRETIERYIERCNREEAQEKEGVER